MLAKSDLIAFVATEDQTRAKHFYQDILGLKLLHQDGYACVFDAHGTVLRVTTVQQRTPAPYTVLGWESGDIAAQITQMTEGGVKFERFPGLQQDTLGIWTSPDGSKVAWFQDPDGNVLSISQHDPSITGP